MKNNNEAFFSDEGDDLSIKEKKYIEKNHKTKSIRQLTVSLGRNPDISIEIIQQHMDVKGFLTGGNSTKIDLEKKEKLAEEIIKDETWSKGRAKFIENLLDLERILPGKEDVIKPREMSRSRKLAYFSERDNTFTQKEFKSFVRQFADLQVVHGDKFNIAEDFQAAIQLCTCNVQLKRQDEYELITDSRYNSKAKHELMQMIIKLQGGLSISRESRLKRRSDSVNNVAEISNKFSDEDFRRHLSQEDESDAIELENLLGRIKKRAERESKDLLQDVEEDSAFLGLDEEDLKELKPEENTAYEVIINNLKEIEEIIKEELYIDSGILERNIKETMPNVCDFFHKILKAQVVVV